MDRNNFKFYYIENRCDDYIIELKHFNRLGNIYDINIICIFYVHDNISKCTAAVSETLKISECKIEIKYEMNKYKQKWIEYHHGLM